MSKAALLPRLKKQPHNRFQSSSTTERISTFNKDQQVSILVRSAVTEGTNKTYKSAVNTMIKFLKKHRKIQSSSDPIPISSMSEAEFIAFLSACKDRGITSTTTYRSALLQAQHADQVQPWAHDQRIITMTAGARGQHKPVEKGAITPDQFEALISLIQSSKTFFTPVCRDCLSRYSTNHRTHNQHLIDMIKLQWLARLRPGELKQIRKRNLTSTFEPVTSFNPTSVQDQIVVPWIVFENPRKNGYGKFMINQPAADHFKAMTTDLQPHDFITSKCCDTHINQAIQEASAKLGWSSSLVWVAHGVRHGTLTHVHAALMRSTSTMITGITKGCLEGHYVHNTQ